LRPHGLKPTQKEPGSSPAKAGLTFDCCELAHPLRSSPITEPSTLLRDDPPLCLASVLQFLWGRHLNFSLSIKATGSHVPHKSLDQVHAISMPDAAQTINRLSLGLSCKPPSIRSFDAVSDISTPQQWFAYAHLLDPYLTRSSPCLSLNAHHNGSLPMQLKVVLVSAPVSRLRGAHPHLLCSYAHFILKVRSWRTWRHHRFWEVPYS